MKKLLLVLLMTGFFGLGFQSEALAASMVFSGAAFNIGENSESCYTLSNEITTSGVSGDSCVASLPISLPAGTIIRSILVTGTPRDATTCDIAAYLYRYDSTGTSTSISSASFDATGQATLTGVPMGGNYAFQVVLSMRASATWSHSPGDCAVTQVKINY